MNQSEASPRSKGAELVQAVPRRRWGRLVLAVLAATGFIWIVYVFATSPNVRWGEIWHYVGFETILDGLWVTVELTVASMLIGIGLGLAAALMNMWGDVVLKTITATYIWIFRGTPLLVQIIFFFNLALFIPRIGIGSFSVSTNVIMTSTVAALLALGLNEGAYMAEIVRGGILSVDPGQMEAAQAQGMTAGQAMRRIVLPQALRVVIPATGNQAIGMLKATPMVSVVSAKDLLTQAQLIYFRNYLVIELLIVVSIWYLA